MPLSGLDPIAFHAFRGFGADIERGGPVRIDHDFIGFDDFDSTLPVLQSLGLPIDRAAIRSASTSGPVIAHLAREGLGVTILMQDMARRTGGLERMLEEEFKVPVPVWLVCHEELRTGPRFRITFDFLADHLSRPGVFT